VRELLTHWQDGRIKLFVAASALRWRRAHPALFLSGTYEPLPAHGTRAAHVVAFARRRVAEAAIAVVPRLLAPLTTSTHAMPVGAESWGDTALLLPDDACPAYRNVFTGETLRVAGTAAARRLSVSAILRTCPFALLVPVPS
jgi:(1->4)-alpha-D-glucan 1-alpha-D-glucosylmutase